MGRATRLLRVAGVVVIVLGVAAVLGVIFLPHQMTCTSVGDCRTDNDVLFVLGGVGRYLGPPLAAAGVFVLGFSLLTGSIRPGGLPSSAPDHDEIDQPWEATMTTESAPRILLPVRALWIFAIVAAGICLAASVVVSLPVAQGAFGTTCDENGCSYSPLFTFVQIVGFLAPSVLIAALLIAVLAIVAGTINRQGGVRLGGPSRTPEQEESGRADDPDAELDELLRPTDGPQGIRFRGYRSDDLTPFMRPAAPAGDEPRD